VGRMPFLGQRMRQKTALLPVSLRLRVTAVVSVSVLAVLAAQKGSVKGARRWVLE
jgi:hypothetical protein